MIYKNEAAKFRAVVNSVKESHEKGQPVLIGTVSIEKSEKLSDNFKKAEIFSESGEIYMEEIFNGIHKK